MSDRTIERQSAKISYETEWLTPKNNRSNEIIIENKATKELYFLHQKL